MKSLILVIFLVSGYANAASLVVSFNTRGPSKSLETVHEPVRAVVASSVVKNEIDGFNLKQGSSYCLTVKEELIETVEQRFQLLTGSARTLVRGITYRVFDTETDCSE